MIFRITICPAPASSHFNIYAHPAWPFIINEDGTANFDFAIHFMMEVHDVLTLKVFQKKRVATEQGRKVIDVVKELKPYSPNDHWMTIVDVRPVKFFDAPVNQELAKKDPNTRVRKREPIDFENLRFALDQLRLMLNDPNPGVPSWTEYFHELEIKVLEEILSTDEIALLKKHGLNPSKEGGESSEDG